MAYKNRNRTTSLEKWERIVAVWSSGIKQTQIAKVARLSTQTVSNIASTFLQHGTRFPSFTVNKHVGKYLTARQSVSECLQAK